MKGSVLDLLDLISEIKSIEEQKFNLILDFKEEFCSKLSKEKEKLPYNINLLDEIHANENAHSRIFVKLMQYKDDGHYKLLESFLSCLGEPFSELKFNNPEITAEKSRIDIRIRGDKKTLIIENKIHGAQDQEKQIKRYIDIEKNAGYDDKNNIYVLYLTKDGGSPSEDSLSEEGKETLEKRYSEINYRNDILPWLKKLSKTDDQWKKTKNVEIIKSAIYQYKDHLEGMFLQREGEEGMKKEIEKFIKEKMGLDKIENLSDQMRIISNYQEYIKEFGKYFKELEIETKENVYSALNGFTKEIEKEKFDGIKNIKLDSTKNRFGEAEYTIIFTPETWNPSFFIGLEFECELDGLFYGIRCLEDNASKELQNKLSTIFGEIENNEFNKWWPYSHYINKGADFNDIIHSVIDGSLLNITKEMIADIIDKTKGIPELHNE